MNRKTGAAALLAVAMILPASAAAQTRSAQPQSGARGTNSKKGSSTAKPQPALTLRQVIESLISLKNSNRVADLISRRGIQFKAGPGVLDILKEFGADQKLLAMIPPVPPPPPPPKPPAPKVAGDVTVVCEPSDCVVVVNDVYKGQTSDKRKTMTGLPAGKATVQVFADGYEAVTRQMELQDGKSHEEKISLARSLLVRQQSAGATLLKTVADLGGIDGMTELGDIEGTGTLHWTDSTGQVREWPMTFRKRIGREFTTTFKTREGQCSASISSSTSKHECRGGMRGSGEIITEQAASLFLSYQLADVVHALMKRPLVASETDDRRLASSNGTDQYELIIGEDSLPSELVYQIGEENAPIRVQYSNYLRLPKSRYPGRTAIGRLNSAPVWVFTLNSVRTNVSRN